MTIIEMFPAGHGNEVLVEDRGGKRRYWLALRELLASGRASLLADNDGPRSDADIEVAGATLASLSSAQLEEVGSKADHIREVLTGYRSGSSVIAGPDEPRRQYTPDLPLGERYRAKADELGVDHRTVRRWVRAYQEHGEAGLAALSRRKPEGRTDKRWLDVAEDVMAENADMSRPNKKSVMHQARARLAAQYGQGVVPVPSRATAYRRLNQIDRVVPTFHGSRERNRDVASRPDREYWKLTPTRPGEYMVMDTNSLDVYALDPLTLKWVNVEMTVAMDAYTRCITGVRVTPTTKSLDVASTLFQTFRPPRAPDDWPAHAVWPEHGVPRGIFPEVQALDGEKRATSHPAIVPETIVVDHGRAFKSQHINSVCKRMGISIQPAHLRTGRDKGIVERFFLSLRLGLLQHLPGYKGPDVYSRGVSPESDAFFYIDELEEQIRKWIAVIYHHRPHDSLFDPTIPAHKLSPAEMFQHGVERAGYIDAPRDPNLAFEFLRPVARQIRHDGVQYHNRMYDGPGLNGLRGHQSDRLGKAARRWFIYINPDDIRCVYFRHPDTRTWHTLFWTHASSLDLPMSEDATQYARKLARARGMAADPEVALEAMLRQWNLDLGSSAAERRIALRLARNRATLVGDLTTDDEDDARAFVESQRAALTDRPPMSPTSADVSTDDVDMLNRDDDEDIDDDQVDDETYYSEAFGET
ncbi:helix-turn-helix domain-containing protein [Mycobacterium colombiense]|uniref:helix-turn-helix domain-containing protein n=1 Tax=Mycobacterium colombiense TaxID=339268 RepID=UPI0020A36A69|nr:helix-turn-helix domain-containing protein [Mycobacterium colombiense]